MLNLCQSQNLIQNFGFEEFTVNVPSQWTLSYGQTQAENIIINEGVKSVKTITQVPNTNTLPLFSLFQDFTLNDTDEYTLKFSYFIPGSILTNTIERVGIGLGNLQESNAFFFPQIPNIAVEYGSWKTVSFPFKVLLFRNGATSVNIRLNISTSSPLINQIVYFDDISVTKTNLSNSQFVKSETILKNFSNNNIELLVSPNPFSYKIYSIDGKIIKECNNVFNELISISDLSSGLYVLNVQSNEKTLKLKFIKN